MTEEHKQKIGNAHRGRSHSAEHNRNISLSMKQTILVCHNFDELKDELAKVLHNKFTIINMSKDEINAFSQTPIVLDTDDGFRVIVSGRTFIDVSWSKLESKVNQNSVVVSNKIAVSFRIPSKMKFKTSLDCEVIKNGELISKTDFNNFKIQHQRLKNFIIKTIEYESSQLRFRNHVRNERTQFVEKEIKKWEDEV